MVWWFSDTTLLCFVSDCSLHHSILACRNDNTLYGQPLSQLFHVVARGMRTRLCCPRTVSWVLQHVQWVFGDYISGNFIRRLTWPYVLFQIIWLPLNCWNTIGTTINTYQSINLWFTSILSISTMNWIDYLIDKKCLFFFLHMFKVFRHSLPFFISCHSFWTDAVGCIIPHGIKKKFMRK